LYWYWCSSTTREPKIEEYDYDCFLLTLPEKEEKRKERFMKVTTQSIPIEIIYGPDTKNVKNARKFEHMIDGEYFEKAVEMHYDNSVKTPRYHVF
jgi:hypothetical protein